MIMIPNSPNILNLQMLAGYLVRTSWFFFVVIVVFWVFFKSYSVCLQTWLQIRLQSQMK